MKFSRLKRNLFIAISFFSILVPLKGEIPENIEGIWEGKDRYVFFERVPSSDSENEFEDRIVIVLKDYYGWYLDRVVEHEDYSKAFKRDRNAATTKDPVKVLVDSEKLWESEETEPDKSGAYELLLTYGKFEKNRVPVSVIDGKMYLEFWVKSDLNPEFWMGNAVTEGIKVSPQVEPENLYSWYIDSENTDEIYRVRFWKSDMEYDPSLEAVIESTRIEDAEYNINKHLLSAGNVYACVPGRRIIVRNLDKKPAEKAFDGKPVVYNRENTIAASDNVYLKQLLDKKSFEELMEIVRVQNSKRKPDPPPLFPPEDLDYHWDMIDLLEKDNVLIQTVRKRQESFGVRGKELGR